MVIRQSVESDFGDILSIINDAARAYKGVIPDDRWHDPYMPTDALEREIADGVVFWIAEQGGEAAGVMGIQEKGDVALIRHAYVASTSQRSGVGTSLLKHAEGVADRPILIGTWAAASWAIEFYRRNGFELVRGDEKDRLLRKYWSIPGRQVETSVVLRKNPHGEFRPDDPRYRAVVDKRFNKRFAASPDYVRLVGSTAELIGAVQDAVSQGRRLVVTSGGHCLEGFVSDPDVRVIIDVSPMKQIYYDAAMRAVAVEAGATVGETFRALFEQWGVVVPLGEYPGIGMGGHVVGGAFGFLCRELGLAADYLCAVEVVTVDAGGRAQSVIATCESSDPNNDLWWAHTGGGGGNFGIVTRYWFRSPGARGNAPAALLPKAPDSITTFRAEWNWSDVDRPSFLKLLANHGAWSVKNSDPGSPNASLWTLLMVHRTQVGKIIIRGLSTSGRPAAERQIRDYLAALGKGAPAAQDVRLTTMSWLDFALDPFPDLFAMPPGGVSTKVKDAMLRRPLTQRQLEVAYDYMTSGEFDVMGGAFGFASYGGAVNAVASNATAFPQRGSIFDMACNVGWMNAQDETTHLAWVRAFYKDLFADTGGVAVPGDEYDGSLINHPDTDVADPALNTSGVPWHTLYYGDNYPRLQRVKARWDPRNIFHHALSIRAK